MRQLRRDPSTNNIESRKEEILGIKDMKLKVPREESPMKAMNYVERGVYLKEFSPSGKKEVSVPVNSGSSTA